MPNTLSAATVEASPFKPGIFKGKVAFVTGGAGTICRVQTELLVLLGADAAIIGRRVEVTEKAAQEIATLRPGAKVIGIGAVDVREVKQLQEAAARTVSELGRIDFVIAGAAGNFLSDVNNLSANAFKSVVSIDLLGSYNTFKATYDQLVKNKGQILFVSANLHYKASVLQAHVSAAKAGVDALAKVIAVELGPLGVKSNVIAPGGIEGTEGIDRLLDKEHKELFLKSIPLQKMGTKQDIAEATAFLFSSAAGHITGQILVVDGGEWHNTAKGPPLYPDQLIQRLTAKSKI